MNWKAVKELNAYWALPLHPACEDKNLIGQNKDWSREKSHKKDQEDYYNCYKRCLEAINKNFLKSAN